MSTTRAVKQREEMISAYKKMLKDETNTSRIDDLNAAIKITEEEMEAIKKSGGKLFGKAAPIKQATTIVEYDKDSQTYKTTFIPKEPDRPVEVKVAGADEALDSPLSNEPNNNTTTPETKDKEDKSPKPASSNKIGNALRKSLKSKSNKAQENSLKAQVAAAKAAKSSKKK